MSQTRDGTAEPEPEQCTRTPRLSGGDSAESGAHCLSRHGAHLLGSRVRVRVRVESAKPLRLPRLSGRLAGVGVRRLGGVRRRRRLTVSRGLAAPPRRPAPRKRRVRVRQALAGLRHRRQLRVRVRRVGLESAAACGLAASGSPRFSVFNSPCSCPPSFLCVRFFPQLSLGSVSVALPQPFLRLHA